MFWWLYGTTAPARETAPLVLWLQGGPGASGTGYGNFGEFGPLDVNLNPRNTTWLQTANLLFVDNPVGAGYSYVDDLALLPTDNAAIAADLVTLLTAFVAAVPEAATQPFFVFVSAPLRRAAARVPRRSWRARAARAAALAHARLSPPRSPHSPTPLPRSLRAVSDARMPSSMRTSRPAPHLIPLRRSPRRWRQDDDPAGRRADCRD